jgi:hypothetical protein
MLPITCGDEIRFWQSHGNHAIACRTIRMHSLGSRRNADIWVRRGRRPPFGAESCQRRTTTSRCCGRKRLGKANDSKPTLTLTPRARGVSSSLNVPLALRYNRNIYASVGPAITVPRCARHFRRWFIGETLGIVNRCSEPNHVTTALLEKSGNIYDLDPGKFRTLIRRRLKQAGMKGVPVIGGFEIAYRAQDQLGSPY